MYRTTDERIEFLEKEMNRQAFQIKLLHAIIQNKEKAGLYELIVQFKLTENSYDSLKHLTSKYEEQLQDGFTVTLSSFIKEVETIFARNDEAIYFHDLSHFIPRWLGGVNGEAGFSPILHKHFYQ
jgi:hypothetical protein